MAISDKAFSNELVRRVGAHELSKVEFEVWVIPGCEGAMVEDINKALKNSPFVSDWGSPSVYRKDDPDFPIIP